MKENLSYFKDKGHKCTGVDYDIDYLNFGKEKGLNLIEGDISNLPIKKKLNGNFNNVLNKIINEKI